MRSADAIVVLGAGLAAKPSDYADFVYDAVKVLVEIAGKHMRR